MKRALLVLFTMLLATAVVDDAYSQGREQRQRERETRRNLRRQQNYRGDSRITLPPGQRYIGVGVALNSFNYFGDLAPTSAFYSTDISFTRPGLGIYGTYRFLSNRIDVSSGFNWGTLRASDASSDPEGINTRYNYMRNLSFRNQIFEYTAAARFYLLEDGSGVRQRKPWNPYAIVGGALFFHNPKAQVPEFDIINNYDANTGTFNPQPITPATHEGYSPGDWVALRRLRTEGEGIVDGVNNYSLIQGAILGGLGIRYKLADYLDLSFDVNIRYLFTDHIDDVSGKYVDLGVLPNDLARVMSDRSLETMERFGGTLSDDFVRSLYPSIFQTYTSQGDNQTYAILPGRGRFADDNIRGKQGNDIYYVAAFKLTYILGGSLKSSNQFR